MSIGKAARRFARRLKALEALARDQKLGSAGATFFNTTGAAIAGEDWTRLRDRWEYSHVARACCAFVAFVALAAAAAY